MYSRVAQWERAGLITQMSVDRNHALLKIYEVIISYKICRMMHACYHLTKWVMWNLLEIPCHKFQCNMVLHNS